MPISKVARVEETGQLQVVVVRSEKKLSERQAAGSVSVTAFDSGSQKTLSA